MNAVWFRLRIGRGSTLRPWIALALLIGFAGGGVLAALAGADRTDTAYPRFLRHVEASDVEVGIERLNGEEAGFLRTVESLSVVKMHARRAYVFIVPLKPNGEPDVSSSLLGQPLAAVDPAMFRTVDQEKVLRGRAADPNRPDEVTVGRELARHFGIRVGQTIDIASFSPAASAQVLAGSDAVTPDGPRLRLHVVGEEVSPGELAAASFDSTPVHLTPAFFRIYGHLIGSSQATRVRLRRGAADLPAFRTTVDRVAAGQGRLTIVDQPGLTAKVQRSIHLQVLALRLFGLLVGVAAAMILGQALARLVRTTSDDYPILAAMGMTRWELMFLSLARVAVVGAVGAMAAVAVATALSRFTPVGLARVVEPSPGLHLDAGVLGIGAVAIFVLVLAMAAWPAWRSARISAARDMAAQTGRSRVADAFARAGSPPSVVAGARLALEPGTGRGAVPVHSTILSAFLAVAALTASVGFGASLSHLLDTPRLYGWGWDVTVGNPYAYDIRDQVVPGLLADRAIAGAASASTASVTVEGRSLTALGIQQLRGRIEPPLVSGRSPERPAEITLGPKTLRLVHRRVGDTVEVGGSGGGTRRMRVVGSAVYPSVGIADPGGVGEGIGLTLDGLMSVVPGSPQNLFPLVLAPGANLTRTVASLQKQYAIGQVNAFKPSRPTDVENYRPVRSVPTLLAAVLGVTAMGALAHTLVSSVQRRRRDLAVLKTLGFLRRDVRATIASQATTIVVVALAVGVPAGVAIGNWAWRAYATQQGVVPEPIVPLLVIAAAAAAILVVANLIAAIPAGSAARTRPSLVLRAE